MDRFQKLIILAFVAGIPAAAAPYFPAGRATLPKTYTAAFAKTASPLCFNSGSTTYELSSLVSVPDVSVKFDDQAARPDLRIGLVDGVAAADFTLVDDALDGRACETDAAVKTVKIVSQGPSDVLISLTRDLANVDFKLFVHSARFNQRDAAALFAALRHNQANAPAAEADAD
jgi:hypothetical protein